MHKIGDYLVYKRDVCKILDNSGGVYILLPINDDSLKITIKSDSSIIRDIISSDEAKNIINEFANVETLDITDKQIENTYKELMKTNNIRDLIPIIKTSYQRNKIRSDENKKISDKDKYYFELAEDLLYTELAISLNKTKDEIKYNIIKTIS